jgi:hypothetical protein
LPDREFKNSARKPLRWKVDFKAKKFFKFGSLIFALFINVDNLFDNLNEMTVYSTTGRATHNAILPEEKLIRDQFIAQEGIFTPYEVDIQPYWYSPPRRVQLGFELRF